MKIQSTKTHQSPKPQNARTDKEANKRNDLTFKDVVTKGAFTAGGALGGTGLGVATGMALSNVSGNAIFGQFGGVAGAVGGAAIGLAASQQGVSKENLAKSVGSWVGASVLSSGGMWVVGKASAHLAAHGASVLLGVNGPLLGAVTGGLVGAAIPFVASDGKISNQLKNAAAVSLGGTAGALAGGGLQALVTAPLAKSIAGLGKEPVTAAALQQVAHTMPQLTTMLAPLPYLGATVLALSALDFKNNPDPWEPEKPNLKAARNTALATTGGYLGGAALGSLASFAFNASPAYLVAAPLVGATAAGLTYLGEHQSGENGYTKAAKTVFTTGLGAGVGDAIGNGLTALTGNDLYRNIGATAGAVNGLAAGLNWSGIDDKKGLPVVTGLLSGGASGVLLGAGISALSGQSVWNTVVPVLGAATGALTGLALSLEKHG
jgi:hypothetical protein